MFNKIVLATSAAVLFSGAAMAADAIVYNEPAPAVMAPAGFSWEGAYAGVNAGYGFGKMKDGDFSAKPRGFVGGVQAGYNWQFDQVVAGIEADFQGSTMKKSFTVYGDDLVDDVTAKAKVQWFGTVRGRVGAEVMDRTLAYGTAGLAYGKAKVEIVDVASASKTSAGWTAGAGLEHAFTDNVTLKTEYLYTDLGKVKFTVDDETAKVKTNFHTVRVGVNYKF